jgi:hypothetical protein
VSANTPLTRDATPANQSAAEELPVSARTWPVACAETARSARIVSPLAPRITTPSSLTGGDAVVEVGSWVVLVVVDAVVLLVVEDVDEVDDSVVVTVVVVASPGSALALVLNASGTANATMATRTAAPAVMAGFRQ